MIKIIIIILWTEVVCVFQIIIPPLDQSRKKQDFSHNKLFIDLGYLCGRGRKGGRYLLIMITLKFTTKIQCGPELVAPWQNFWGVCCLSGLCDSLKSKCDVFPMLRFRCVAHSDMTSALLIVSLWEI